MNIILNFFQHLIWAYKFFLQCNPVSTRTLSSKILMTNSLKTILREVRMVNSTKGHWSERSIIMSAKRRFSDASCNALFILHNHREITPTELCRPRFHAPLHISPPPPGPAGVCRPPQGRGRSLAAFNVTLLILVLEIPFNF